MDKQTETAKRLVRETIDRSQPNDRAELIEAINQRFPGGSGGVGMAQNRMRWSMIKVVDQVIAEIIEARREDTRAGYESRYENRHEAFDNYA